ncbi:MAG: mandelate racemase/muconate lactonizing enzyme family protein [Reyranella sp.]|uniref:mandelate racemase/muconate lactonizing enzyme family protein n=1 Tax=Reyranella sp. TaxID=1929291 RepID=UPI00273182A2|nr:mandelate racemase/muconate lactonizing enzyme family protein [Reyranella sp.]MDP1962373.1 mandelate racemase/muconate lactonizing enzyme family protein [Reyranella sp.]MDP2373935.1 mandelate racemase/muconate lactonizing enzyme family protein [Reyranella sp.]
MSATLARVEAHVFHTPIAEPIRTSFGTMTERVAVFVRVEDSDGARGWGEIWSNFPTASAEHRALLFADIVAPRVLGKTLDDPVALWSELDRALHVLRVQSGDAGALSAAAAGLDLAIHDLRARKRGLPLWRALGGSDDRPVPVYGSGLNPGPAAFDTVGRLRAAGYRAFKIKIGFGAATDLGTLRPVARALDEGERLMVDVNQGWDLRTACTMTPKLAEFGLHWIEEPLLADRPMIEWTQVAAVAPTQLAAGENLRGAGPFQEMIDSGLFGVIQPDAAKWGGHSGCLPVARAALAAGRTYCPHFLGGAIGLLHSLHLLAAVRGPGLLEVDANPNPLREGLLGDVLTVRDGGVSLPDGQGLGLEPDIKTLAPFRTLHLERRA